MTRQYTTSLLLALLVSSATSASARPDPAVLRESVVQIVVMGPNDVRRVGSGFAVAADGYVLTAAHLVANENRVLAVPLSTGAELLARVLYVNDRADLALLSVNGLDLAPLKLAKNGFNPGRLVYSAGAWSDAAAPVLVAEAEEDVSLGFAEGSVGKHDDLAGANDLPAVPLIEHNAMIPAYGYGGPLLNECGEIAGLNRGSPGMTTWRLRRGQAPEGVVHALRATAITGLIQPQGVAFVQSEELCADALASAQAEAEEVAEQAEETREQLEQSRQELEEATGQVEETRQQIEQARQEQERAAARAAEAESRVGDLEARHEEAVRVGDEQAEALRAELDAAREEQAAARTAVDALESEMTALEERLSQDAEADRMRLIVTLVVSGILVVTIVFVAVVGYRRRSRQLAAAQEEAERARQAAADAHARSQEEQSTLPDCLLSGQTEDGHPVSVKIPGGMLGGEGVVIGRSPRNSTFLIDDRTLSREHARLFGDDDSLYIEDLGSTNGTRVNGGAVAAGTPVAVRRGDTVELGAVEVELIVDG